MNDNDDDEWDADNDRDAADDEKKTMQIHLFLLHFQHIARFEAISTYATVNGTGATSTFSKFT